jgi:hypothetical protein
LPSGSARFGIVQFFPELHRQDVVPVPEMSASVD